MMSIYGNIGLIISMVASLFSPQPTGLIRHDVPIEACIELAADSVFDCVGLAEDRGEGFGSAVLIDSMWVLTAAHVVTGTKVKKMRIRFGDSVYLVVKAIRHPGHKRENADIALILLGRPVRHIQPVALYQGQDELGMVGTAIGYGAFGTPFDPDQELENEFRLGGTNVIDQIGGETALGSFEEHFLLVDLDHPQDSSFSSMGGELASPMEYLPIGGDSGGGLFVQENNSYRLAGIFAEFGMKFKDGIVTIYGSIGAFTRVSVYREWIESELKKYHEKG